MKTRAELMADAEAESSEGMTQKEYNSWRYARRKLGMKTPLRKRGRKRTIPMDGEGRRTYIKRHSQDYYTRVTHPKRLRKRLESEEGERTDARSSPFITKRRGKKFCTRPDLVDSTGSIALRDKMVTE